MQCIEEPAPAHIDPRGIALFLDLDGTLAPIVEDPAAARIPPATLRILARLQRRTDGALAIVSGRDAATVERMVAPLETPYAALHGAQIRQADGRLEEISLAPGLLQEVNEQLKRASAGLAGTVVESKALSVAFHYRSAPWHEAEVRRAAQAAVLGKEEVFSLQEGKMVVEIKPRSADKGRALMRLMDTAPFAGRTPVFAGDDLTDESGFQVVNAMGGISIKVGPGPTGARWRLAGPQALATWLNDVLDRDSLP